MFELRVEWTITGKKSLEQKSFEEPGRVRQVPPDRADIGHGLQAVIVRCQRLAQRLALAPHAAVVCRRCLPRCGMVARDMLCLPGPVADDAHHCASLRCEVQLKHSRTRFRRKSPAKNAQAVPSGLMLSVAAMNSLDCRQMRYTANAA